MQEIPTADPIFIIGAPRSGTSVMTWALGQHPDIQPMPETVWIAGAAVGAYLAHQSGSDRENFSHLSNVDYPLDRFFELQGGMINQVVHEAFDRRLVKAYGEARAPRPGQLKHADKLFLKRHADEPKTAWVDGTPLNTFYTWALARMFPDARFLHHVRAPHQVVASLEKFDRVGATPVARENALDTWMRHAQAGHMTRKALGASRVFQVDFSRLETDTEGLLKEVFAFLGKPHCAESLDPFAQRLNSSGTHASDLRDELSATPLFKVADDLYQTIMSDDAAASGDETAMDFIHELFLTMVETRKLVG